MAPKAGKAKAKPATAKPTPKAPSAKKAPKAKADASLTPLSPDTVAKYKNQWKSWTSAPSSQPEALVEAAASSGVSGDEDLETALSEMMDAHDGVQPKVEETTAEPSESRKRSADAAGIQEAGVPNEGDTAPDELPDTVPAHSADQCLLFAPQPDTGAAAQGTSSGSECAIVAVATAPSSPSAPTASATYTSVNKPDIPMFASSPTTRMAAPEPGVARPPPQPRLEQEIEEAKSHPMFPMYAEHMKSSHPKWAVHQFGAGFPKADLHLWTTWLSKTALDQPRDSGSRVHVPDRGYPLPPDRSEYPDINDFLPSAAEVMVSRACSNIKKVMPGVSLADKLRALPSELVVGDFFSGSGSMHQVVSAAMRAFRKECPDETAHIKVSHAFMAEWIAMKQRFLLSAYDDKGCCLFNDATTVFTSERWCVRHEAKCDLPHRLWLFNGGFSCKSFSRLNTDNKALKHAMAEGNEGASSVLTFKACITALSTLSPDWFLLENVDMDDDPAAADSNLSLINGALQECGPGFNVKIYKLSANEYGLPTRRTRLYFIGFNLQTQPQANFARVDRLLSLFKLKSQPPEDYMLPADAEPVTNELTRRMQARARADDKASKDTLAEKADKTEKAEKDKEKEKDAAGKWKQAHMELAEKRGIPWPLQPPQSLQASDWFCSLSEREQENHLFVLDASNTLKQTNRPALRYADLYHSAYRTPSSTSEVTPTVLPSSKMMDMQCTRLFLGRELLHLQGLQFPKSLLDSFSENQMTDLAGNSFATSVCLSIFVAGMLELCYATESEEEEEDDVNLLVKALQKHRG